MSPSTGSCWPAWTRLTGNAFVARPEGGAVASGSLTPPHAPPGRDRIARPCCASAASRSTPGIGGARTLGSQVGRGIGAGLKP